MRVLEGDAAGADRRFRHEGERLRRSAPRRAVELAPGLRIEVEIIGARALVGVGDRAALRQAPGAGHGDRAVDAARAGGRASPPRSACAASKASGTCTSTRCGCFAPGNVRAGGELAPRHVGHAAVDRRHSRQPGQRSAMPRQLLQIARRRSSAAVGCAASAKRRRRHRAQAVEAEAGGQQVVAAAMVATAFGREHIAGGCHANPRRRQRPNWNSSKRSHGLSASRRHGYLRGESQPVGQIAAYSGTGVIHRENRCQTACRRA